VIFKKCTTLVVEINQCNSNKFLLLITMEQIATHLRHWLITRLKWSRSGLLKLLFPGRVKVVSIAKKN